MRFVWVLAVFFGVWVGQALCHSAQGNVSLRPGSIEVRRLHVPDSKVDFSPAPQGNSLLDRGWIRISVEFATQQEMTDEVKLKFYAEGYDVLVKKVGTKKGDLDSSQEKFVILTGETAFINVPRGRHHQAAMFVHPSSARRYGGRRGEDWTNQRSNIRVEIFEKNRTAGFLDLKKDPDENWIKKGPTKQGVLLGLKESPWWPLDIRKYNQLKP